MRFSERLIHAWNAFSVKDASERLLTTNNIGYLTTTKPDRVVLRTSNERSILASVINRIAIDVASIPIQHVRTDQNGRYLETIDSSLNECLNISANKDQTGRQFIQDVVMSLCDEGCIAIVPVDTNFDIVRSTSFDILSMRTGKILEWYPDYVRVNLYDDRSGQMRELVLPKRSVAIIENPLYAVMNEPNSTLRRLIRKLNILDAIDEQSGSGKLDLIISLPYQTKTDAKKRYAEERKKDIEEQLARSKFGIAYMDANEHITQLNRPVENNLMTQIEYLTRMFYNQLGMTEEVFNGTADEKVTLNYHTRTIAPILSAITDEINRKFLTKTARSQHQTIMYFRDPFKLVPANDMAEIADKFTRNEILSSNEVRAIIGYKPVDDPRADELRNKNLNQDDSGMGLAPMYTDNMGGGGYEEDY